MPTKNFLIILFIFNFTQIFGQNLVPNPSFEDTLYCPNYVGNVSAMTSWKSFGNSVDSYNACSQPMNVPNSQFGFQYAHTGDGMIGIITYVWQLAPGWPNYREYAGATLINTMIIGQKYYISFYMNCAGYLPGWQMIGANKMGLRFSTIEYDSLTPPLPNNFAHLFTDSILTDTVQWLKVSGSFIADSAYSHIIMGSFFDATNTDTIIFGGAPFGGSYAYYYIDDVCVSTDSLYCNSVVGIESTGPISFVKIFPIPFADQISLQVQNNDLTTVIIYDLYGKAVLKSEFINTTIIDTQDLTKGFYIYELKNKSGIIGSNKIFKQ